MDGTGSNLYYSNMSDFIHAPIPTYNLYGESSELPDILHCERIVERAALHDWNIGPHRHSRLHQFFLIRNGGGIVRIDGRSVRLEPPMVLNMPALSVHEFEFEPRTEGLVITIPAEVLEAGIGNSDALAAILGEFGVARADAGIISLFEDIAAEHAGSGFGRAHALNGAVALAVARVARLLRPFVRPQDDGGQARHLRRFEGLVDAHFREHWRVADYAREMAMSPTHLSRLTRAETGQPASALIEARLMREARRALAYTNLTIAQIAYENGFDDPAYFTRAFTRCCGVTPSAWRRRFEAPAAKSPLRG